MSVLLHPLLIGSAPLRLWRDWSRRLHRRACRQLLRDQRLEVLVEPTRLTSSDASPLPLSRAQRARRSTLVARAASSQCSFPHGRSGNDPPVRCPRKLCGCARFGNGVTSPRLHLPSLFSDRLASLSGTSWPFSPSCSSIPLLFSLFCSSSCCCFCHPHAPDFSFCTAFVLAVQELTSSTTSLRNSWGLQGDGHRGAATYTPGTTSSGTSKKTCLYISYH